MAGVFCVSLALCSVFIYCHFATQISERLNAFGLIAFQSYWFKYPIELRKYLTLTIARSQMRFNFTGLNIFYCNTATFATVRTTKITTCCLDSEAEFFVCFRLYVSFALII